MSLAVTKPNPVPGELSLQEVPLEDKRAQQAERFRLLWDHRRFLSRLTVIGLIASGVIAFLLPKTYTSTAQLMPPDQQSTSGIAMFASLAVKGSSGLGSLLPDLLGMNTTGALFVGILRSDAAQSGLVQRFDLRKVYHVRLEQDARKILDRNTTISEDRKSGIITIRVMDHSPHLAATLARGYVDELDVLIAQLSTSAAHRERVFLEDRLKVVKHDLDDAANDLAQFSSQNSTVDIQTMGKAAVEATGTLAGELIAAQAELEGLRQIYADDNPRVRSLNARVAELRKTLDKLGGTKKSPGPDAPNDSGAAIDSVDGRSFDFSSFSLHNLPLLGVKYADFYRRAKIQETVFELLTQQYELAKIQEAKETPSVKVLDQPKVAERKSSPPRLLLTLLGGFLSFCAAVAWVVGSASWRTADPKDPRKILAEEMFSTIKVKVPWFSHNGHGAVPVDQEGTDQFEDRRRSAEHDDGEDGR